MKRAIKTLVLFSITFLFFALSVYATALQDKVENQIKKAVISALSLPEENVKVSLRNPAQLDLPENSDMRISLLSDKEPKGIVPLRVEIYDSEKLLKTMVLTVEVKIYEDVVVTAKKLDRNEKIAADMLTVERRDVTNFTDSYFKSADQIKNQRAKSIIPKGRILGRSSLENIPLVNQGDKVKILAEIGGIKVWAYGMAREDGKLGEEIKITNMDSKRIITARVVDEQTVSITLEQNL
jgi:flagella basal body P-ring formation protein FlgA